MNLGKYQTGDLIGRGGMSSVYRGRDVLLGRDVAIKVLKTSLAGEDGPDYLDSSARFLNEAKITGRLQHPSIVTLFDFGTTAENETYIVMEFVEGQSLRHHLGKLTKEQIGEILRGVASGLDYAHQNGVIHRDVKPSNLLLTSAGNPKILDFGIALAAGTGNSRLTQTGIVVGSPDYMAPEQVSGAALSAAADQFALAVVTFELLTGKLPFAGSSGMTMMATMTAILMQPPLDALTLNPTLGEKSIAVLLRALSKQPEERFASCSEFVDSLLGALRTSEDWRPFSADQSGRVVDQAEAGANLKGRLAADISGPSRTQTLVATRTRLNLPITVGLSVVGAGVTPPDYSFTQALGSPGPFFGSGESHFHEIKSKLNFYQEQLQKEYDALIQQMRTTYVLWLVAVTLAFLVLVMGVVLFLLHQTTGGAVTTASSAMLYFLQRIFQQREDMYRKSAEAKRSTVEYGNQWALVIQTIQGMEDPKERILRESRLVETLTEQLGMRSSSSVASVPSRRVRRPARPDKGLPG